MNPSNFVRSKGRRTQTTDPSVILLYFNIAPVFYSGLEGVMETPARYPFYSNFIPRHKNIFLARDTRNGGDAEIYVILALTQ